MKNIWFIVFCFLCLHNCKNSKSKSPNPLVLVPEHTEIIIKINSTEGLESGIKNNALIKAIENFSQIEDLKTLLIPIYHINKDNSFITLSKSDKDSLEISYVIPLSKKSITLDSIPNLTIDSTFKNKASINKLYYNNTIFYSKAIDSILFVSNQLELTEKASTKNEVDSEIERLYKVSDNEKMVSVFLNNKHGNFKPLIFNDSILNQLQFTNYSIIDSDISQNAIYLNGITKAKDSSKCLINIFKNTLPQENKIASILPNDIESFKSFTFDDYNVFKHNLIFHNLQDSIPNHLPIFQNIVEIGQVKLKTQEAFIYRSIDPIATQDLLNTQIIHDEYRSVNIYALNGSDSTLLNSFTPLLSKSSVEFYTIIDDFFVFSNNVPLLQSVISSYQNNSVLSESEAYKDLKLDLSDEASILIFGNSKELKQRINKNFSDDIKLDIPNFKASMIQYIYDTDFAHVNAIFKTHKTKRSHNSISEELNISIDADILTPPQLVKNHTNGQMDIAVQDVNNNLYLISNKGKVFWKKQIDGKIMGNIQQIDTYKNGRLQMVFNTSKRLYVLDRNGKDVNAFPLKFNEDITQPVSVFDYDKKKKYRLMITQGKSVQMYDKNGDKVSGFTYTTAPNHITSQPKHFRISSKDFIVFSSGNRLVILDRVGKNRVAVKEDISFSDNGIYLYKNRFTTSNTNGELLEINQSGRVNHKNLNANSDHKIATTSKTLVVMNDNKLTIKSKTIELDFGNYTAPKIFYVNDKIYVSVTDLQSKKGYLFDSQAKPIANFPIYANSELELNDIDKDKSLEVVTKGDNDAIIVYEF